MNSWSKIASAFVAVAGLSLAQTTPANGPSPTPATTVGTTPETSPPVSQTASVGNAAAQVAPSAVAPAVGTQAAAAKHAPCEAGQVSICVARTLRSLMFNPDGTHRSDSEIAVDVPPAIAEMIKDGSMKPENAPKTPIKGFDDAIQFLSSYPMGDAGQATPLVTAPTPSATAPTPSATAPTPSATAPKTAEPCPADRPWLCAAPPPPNPGATAASGSAKPTAAKPAAAASAKASGSAAPKADSGKTSTAKPPADVGVSPAKPAAEAPLYVLGVNDVIQVTVYDEKTIPGTYAITPDGRISVPLLGNFTVVGLTINDLKELLKQKCIDDAGILEPIVNVQLLRSNSKQYVLTGGFAKTGPIPLIRETTILEALSAVGFKEFAKQNQIELRRGNQQFHFKWKELIKGLHPDQNITIQDGDIIYVPE